jgi:hypothetical protein
MDRSGSEGACSKLKTGIDGEKKEDGRRKRTCSATTYLSTLKSKRQLRRLGRQGQTRACLKHPMDLRERS